jgi:hypothetical protein
MKKTGIILAIAASVLLFASAFEAKENAIEDKSSPTARASLSRESILFSPPELGFIRNNSSMTLCAEEDNIDIPLYYPNLTAYRLIATHPTYLPTNVTDKGKNCTNCQCTNKTSIAKKIYDDGNVIIEAVKESPWWRNEEGMNITAKGGMSMSNATYFRIYKLIDKGYGDYPQIFVLYEDGNSRIIPEPPLDLKNVTFGSSVILGLLDIDNVEIDPSNLAMDIAYSDKTTAHVELQVDRTRNIVEVSNITYDTSNHPFARFRSMWVTDGNADIDHIRTRDGVFPIMGGWTELKGTWWQFFRKVPSIHNTYCPDIKIEVIS